MVEKIKSFKLPGCTVVSVEHITSGVYTLSENFIFNGLPNVYRILIAYCGGNGSFTHIEVWLPEEWNGIFIANGNGGMAGSLVTGACIDQLRQGYATASSDLGTSKGRDSGINNPQVWKDFGWRATHMTAVVAKRLCELVYGRLPDWSYFYGQSTGGQQGYAMAERFPEDFDGIIAGVPANNRVFLHTYFLWIRNHMYTREGRTMFTDAEISAVTDAAVAFMQSKGDGERGDAFISFPWCGENTVSEFMDFLRVRFPSFTSDQLDALRAVYTGPVNPRTGEQIYNGVPIGSEKYGGIKAFACEYSAVFYPFIWAFGADYDLFSFDFDRDLERLSALLSPELDANSADLSAFAARGGRLLAYAGAADSIVPYPEIFNHFMRTCESCGSIDNVREFYRLFLLPGKDHGNDGDGANAWWADDEQHDMIYAIRKWCEQGEAPDSLVAAHVVEGEVQLKRHVLALSTVLREGVDFPKCCDRRYY